MNNYRILRQMNQSGTSSAALRVAQDTAKIAFRLGF
jgi:hypothetical protein